MKLKQIKIKNFRGFINETVIDVEHDITAFIGGNDAGKSSIMEALDIFFNGGIDKDDASVSSQSRLVSISCVFDDLPDRVVIDATRQTTLAQEYLLTENNRLEIKKVFDCSLEKPRLVGNFAFALHPDGENFRDLLSLKILELRRRALDLQVDLSGVNQSVCSEMRAAIWGSQEQNLIMMDVALDREDAKRVYDALSEYFPLFALFKSDRASTDQDEEAQDPMRVVIREVIDSVAEEFNAIENRIQTALREDACTIIQRINEISPALGPVLTPNVMSKKLESLFSVSLTGENEIPINKRGSGVRRLVLLGFFRATAERRLAKNTNRGLVYAIEEPETSQHPNNQLLILSALRDIASGGCEQVLLTTHTPVLAARLDERSIRYVVRDAEGIPRVKNINTEADRRQMAEHLGVLPDNRVRVFWEVEGPNDISFLKNVSRNLSRLHPLDYLDLGQAESDGFLIFVPMGGGILQCWANRLNELRRRIFHLVDRDFPPPREPHYINECNQFIAAGDTVFITDKRELENYIPLSIIQADQPEYAGTGDDFEDVPELFSQATRIAYDNAYRRGERPLPKIKGRDAAKRYLNMILAARINTDALFDEGDPNGELRNWIRTISGEIRE